MPIFHYDLEQGTAEWAAMRMGIPTASCFDQIITPAKGEFSKSSRGYAFKLIAERLLNVSVDSIDHLEHVSRGKTDEPLAIQQYEFTEEVKTRAVGFVTTDDQRFGASPDRVIIGQPGLVEVKCPAAWTHIGYLIDGPGDKYRPQVQGQLYVSEADFVDFYAYHQALPPVKIRTHRDPHFLALLSSALERFDDMMQGMLEVCRASGFFDAAERNVTAIDRLAQELGASNG